MLARDRTLVTAAPTTKKQVSAMIVIALDKPFSGGGCSLRRSSPKTSG
jgi:hypothetical protein